MPDAAHLPALSMLVGACRAMVERLREYDSISLCTWDSGVTSYPTIYLTAEVRVGPPCHQGPSDMAGSSSRGFIHARASACLVSHGSCLSRVVAGPAPAIPRVGEPAPAQGPGDQILALQGHTHRP